MLGRLFALVLASSLIACVQAPVSVPKSLQGVSADKTGLVFGSIGTDGDSRFSTYALRYRAVGSKDQGEFRFQLDQLHLVKTSIDFNKDNAAGTVFSVRLPAGDYELFNVMFYENHGQYGSSTFTSKRDFSINFSVKEGQAVYLGEYLGRRVTGKNIFYLPVSAGGYFMVADRLDRDVAVLEKRGEPVSRDTVENLVPRVLEKSVPLLRAEPLPEQ
jgi:hypothetical protein